MYICIYNKVPQPLNFNDVDPLTSTNQLDDQSTRHEKVSLQPNLLPIRHPVKPRTTLNHENSINETTLKLG